MTSQRDRIESLESRVEELEATIRGLTEELVEANQRIKDLETAEEERDAATGATEDANASPDRPAPGEKAPADEEAKNDEFQGENETDDEGGSELGDDIIVA